MMALAILFYDKNEKQKKLKIKVQLLYAHVMTNNG